MCSVESPCLFDVMDDPREATNVAASPDNAPLLAKMQGQLATYVVYAPKLTTGNLQCYNCTISPATHWHNFTWPCCMSNHSS